MSKMGSTIVACMDIVNNTATFEEAESQIRHQYGDMFVAIAEEYYRDKNDATLLARDFEEMYDVDSFEDLVDELTYNENEVPF